MSISGDGQFLAVGGPVAGTNVGATWMYKNQGTSFNQIGSRLIPSDKTGIPRFGKGGSSRVLLLQFSELTSLFFLTLFFRF